MKQRELIYTLILERFKSVTNSLWYFLDGGGGVFQFAPTSFMYMHIYMCSIIFFIIIDSHHNLIRWRMVTHVAIDGYS